METFRRKFQITADTEMKIVGRDECYIDDDSIMLLQEYSSLYFYYQDTYLQVLQHQVTMRTQEADQDKTFVDKTITKGCKRELTSPVQQELQVKKCRPKFSADSDTCLELDESIDQLNGLSSNMQAGAETEVPSPSPNQDTLNTYYLSKPLLPDDICNIARELKMLMIPEVKATVKDEIKEDMSVFGTLLENAIQSINKTITDEVGSLKIENEALRKRVSELETRASKFEKRAVKVEKAIDAHEQYSRRNSVRISGIKEAVEREGTQQTDRGDTGRDRREDTDEIVLNIAKDIGINLVPRDIDRSHRAGKNVETGRSILVKFATYRARQAFLGNRSKRKSIPQWKNAFINEDLTKKRSEILFYARQLVKQDKINAAFSLDGRIFIKDNQDNRHLIESKESLKMFGFQSVDEQITVNHHESSGTSEPMDSASAW